MARFHLFEFEDLKWLPKIFRRFITDLLSFQIDRFGIYHATHEKIQEILNKTGHDTIVDLCSGSGGPAPGIRNKVSLGLGRDVNLVLTDKYPNLEIFNAFKQPYVIPVTASVDATKVLPYLKGFRTMFTAFHHFKPEQAQHILQDAVNAKMPIGIFEITERKAVSLMTLLVAPITCLIFSLFVRPYKISRIFWTYIIPVIPFIYTWDGLISNLRTYTKEEWLEMTKRLKGDDFVWETGEMVSKFHIKVSYLTGYPKTKN